MIYNHGLRFLAIFLMICCRLTAQVDSSNLVQLRKLDNPKNDYYFAEVDTYHIGVLNKSFNWVKQPEYCAIYEFSATKGLASVLKCPIKGNWSNTDYWDEHPLKYGWGVVDSTGNWVVDPSLDYPFELSEHWQINSNKLFSGKHLLWPGEYDHVKNLFDSVFLLSKASALGLRSIDGEWLVPFRNYLLLNYGDSIWYFIPNASVDAFSAFPINAVNSDKSVQKFFAYEHKINILYPNVAVLRDSVFGKWFLYKYCLNENLNSIEDYFSNDNYEKDIFNFAGLFADTIYMEVPDWWWPYYRVNDYSRNAIVVTTGKSTYSIIENLTEVNMGSRGAAHESTIFSFHNFQKLDTSIIELNFLDCIKDRDSNSVAAMFAPTFGDSTPSIVTNLVRGTQPWMFSKDSLQLLFMHPDGIRPLEGYYKSYKVVRFSIKDLGRSFLSERKRERQLRKGKLVK